MCTDGECDSKLAWSRKSSTMEASNVPSPEGHVFPPGQRAMLPSRVANKPDEGKMVNSHRETFMLPNGRYRWSSYAHEWPPSRIMPLQVLVWMGKSGYTLHLERPKLGKVPYNGVMYISISHLWYIAIRCSCYCGSKYVCTVDTYESMSLRVRLRLIKCVYRWYLRINESTGSPTAHDTYTISFQGILLCHLRITKFLRYSVIGEGGMANWMFLKVWKWQWNRPMGLPTAQSRSYCRRVSTASI